MTTRGATVGRNRAAKFARGPCFVRAPGFTERTSPPPASKRSDGAGLEILSCRAGRERSDKAPALFPNRAFTHPFRVPGIVGGQPPGVSLRSTPGSFL
ncbi:MAG TPA: hypothetical protein DDY91_02595 [Planctomycetaceae bacterium]|nr:hypothetical protein [Planctomycetaceae bacterium]